MNSAKHYIVTGGAGFIGSHLVEALIGAGHEVTVIDNFASGHREHIPAEVTIIEKDIRDKNLAAELHGADGVFHVAGLPNVQESLEHPDQTHSVNLTGTLNVLLAAKAAGVSKVVFSSSAAVYGDTTAIPTPEDSSIVPLSPYGLEKYLGEQYCQLFSRIYGLSTVCLRYANAYGSRMANKGAYLSVVKIFLEQHLRNEPLTITGDGEQTRDCVHVRDIVRANILAMERKELKYGEVINIGSGRTVTVNHLADLIGGEKKYIPARMEIKHSLLDISRASKLLGWTPQVQLQQGIEELKSAGE